MKPLGPSRPCDFALGSNRKFEEVFRLTTLIRDRAQDQGVDFPGSRFSTNGVARPACVHSPAISEPSALIVPVNSPRTLGVSKCTLPASSVILLIGIRAAP